MASNPTLSQIKVGNVVYDICDANTRSSVSSLQEEVSSLQNSVTTLNNSVTTLGNKKPLDDFIKLGSKIQNSVTFNPDGTTVTVSMPTYSGYQLVGCIGYNISESEFFPNRIQVTDDHTKITGHFRSKATTTRTGSLTFTGLYVKTTSIK